MARILHRGNDDDGLMRGEGKFEIVQWYDELKRQLMYIEVCGRICYRSERRKTDSESADNLIRRIIKSGHESGIEHSSLTVIFSDVSRGFTHEMVRHRLCAFSQESTRYCDYSGGKLDLDEAELTFIYPPHKESTAIDIAVIDGIESNYKIRREQGWPPQDARQFLPIGIASKIAVTANFREWRHIMAMRTQKAAHWEIRSVMCDLLAELKDVIPVIFEDFYRPYRFNQPLVPILDKDGYAYYVQK